MFAVRVLCGSLRNEFQKAPTSFYPFPHVRAGSGQALRPDSFICAPGTTKKLTTASPRKR